MFLASSRCPLLINSRTNFCPTPSCFSDVVKSSEWRRVTESEYNSLLTNRTWSLVTLPPNHVLVGYKLVFKVKYKVEGTLDKHKAILVAKGYHQTHGVDYTKTFSLVVKPTTIRLILSLVVQLNWSLKKLDISNAFLHGSL